MHNTFYKLGFAVEMVRRNRGLNKQAGFADMAWRAVSPFGMAADMGAAAGWAGKKYNYARGWLEGGVPGAQSRAARLNPSIDAGVAGHAARMKTLDPSVAAYRFAANTNRGGVPLAVNRLKQQYSAAQGPGGLDPAADLAANTATPLEPGHFNMSGQQRRAAGLKPGTAPLQGAKPATTPAPATGKTVDPRWWLGPNADPTLRSSDEKM